MYSVGAATLEVFEVIFFYLTHGRGRMINLGRPFESAVLAFGRRTGFAIRRKGPLRVGALPLDIFDDPPIFPPHALAREITSASGPNGRD